MWQDDERRLYAALVDEGSPAEVEKSIALQRRVRAHARETALVRRIVEGLSTRARIEISSKLRWKHTAVTDDTGATNRTRAIAVQMEQLFAAILLAQNQSFPTRSAHETGRLVIPTPNYPDPSRTVCSPPCPLP